MAQKKLIYDLNGKVRESNANYYDDVANNLVLKNVTFNSMSVNLPDGIAFFSGSQISSSNANELQVISWDNTAKVWRPSSALTDIVETSASAPVNSDLSGTFDDIKVTNLSNVNRGAFLQVEHGGTGLNTSSIPTGESILLGNGTGSMQFLTASSTINPQILISTLNGWSLITQSFSADTEIQIYSTPGAYTWVKPEGTKAIRIIAQGGGGGGGAGANKSNYLLNSRGGAGGASGGFIDVTIDEYGQFTTGTIIVGAGGRGGNNYPVVPFVLDGIGGEKGINGESSSFSSGDLLVFASAGGGGGGGTTTNSTIAGGLANASNTNINILYNKLILNGYAGADTGTTAGVNSLFVSSSNTYSPAGGGSGGSIPPKSFINYDGGNGSSDGVINKGTTTNYNALMPRTSSFQNIYLKDNFYKSNGGGGGASAAVTSALDINLISKFNNIVTHLDLQPNGSTTSTIDSSKNSYTITFSGNATLSTGPAGVGPINGTHCLYIPPTGVSTSGLSSGRVAFGRGAFTLEAWVYITEVNASAHRIMDIRAGGSTNGGIAFSIDGNNKVYVNFNSGGPGPFYSNSTIPLNEWTHIVFTRNTTNNYFYINGILDATGTGYSGNAFNDAGTTAWYGYTGYAPVSGRILKGYMDRASIISGQKYTSNFTPETDILNLNFNDSYLGGIGSSGMFGSGGGGGGASNNYTGSSVQQGGNGGDGYVVVVSYKY